MKHKNWFFRNSLSIVFIILTVLALWGQTISGKAEYNENLKDHQVTEVSTLQYLHTGHFIQATFENWESEFLQMALFVILSIRLFQLGSSESRPIPDPAKKGELTPKINSPWSVKKGGFFLVVYKNSLSIVFLLLFVFSYAMHAYGSWLDFNENQFLDGKPGLDLSDFLFHSKLWFESFQNWQSEFLSIFAIVFLSVYLRQKGSPQSKPVNMSHQETE